MPAPKEASPTLSPDEIEIYRAATKSIRNQAAGHAEHGRFSLVERPDGYYQDFREIYFPPTEEPNLEIIGNVCRAIMSLDENDKSYFDHLLDAFSKNQQSVQDAKVVMENGGRVLLITDHRELADIAMAMAGAQISIGSLEVVKGTRIFVGPIVKELEIMGIGAVEALQYSTGIIVGIPDTDNTDDKIESGEIDAGLKVDTNTAVSNEFQDQIVRKQIKLVATAPSGSTDVETADHILMKKVSSGTDLLGRRYFDALWPIAIIMDKGRMAFEVGDLIKLGKGETLHDVMEKVLAPMYSRVSGKTVSYERPEQTSKKRRHQSLGQVASSAP